MRRTVAISINTILMLVIASLILATWMPAIYTSQWFQNSPWAQAHLLRAHLLPNQAPAR
jgi:hypothetical protein